MALQVDMAPQQKLSEKSVCFHCGADTGSVPVILETHSFCCEGCSAVYSLLKQNAMCNYYDLNAHPGKTQRNAFLPEYAFVDDPAVSSQLLEYSDGKSAMVTFFLPAVHCSSCIWLLENLFKLKAGIRRSEVNFRRKEVHITYDPGQLKLSEVAALLHSLGYPPDLSLDKTDSEKPAGARANQSSWLKVGLAGFCFGNIMLLSFPEYFGMDDLVFAKFFGYLNIVLSIPVLVYSGSGYFVSAWNGIRNRMVNMDVPIALGMVVIFARSVYEILSHTGSGYLDSLAALVFFLLLGKVFQNKTFDLLSFERDFRSYFPLGVLKKKGEGTESVPVVSLKKGDRILLRNAELIPADSVLIRGASEVDYSFVTGESDKMPKKEGELLYAGGRHFGSTAELEVMKEVSQSYLTRLWNHEAFRKADEGEVTRVSNRLGRNFTIAVLIISALASVYWAFADSSMIVKVVSSVLIVACPCALALSVPFTLGSVMAMLGRNGFYLKGPAVIEQLSESNALVFDKTGTLTRPGKAGLSWQGEKLSSEEESALRSLFSHSTHPLSISLFRHLEGEIQPVEQFSEEAGKGLSGKVSSSLYRAGSASYCGTLQKGTEGPDGARVYVSINQVPKGYFLLESSLREGIAGLMIQSAKHHTLSLLSGDNEKDKKTFEEIFPIGSDLVFHQTPESKLEYIRGLQQQGKKVVMVGDGLNDAGALRQSDAGISVAEDVSTFTPASDAIISADSVSRLPVFLDYTRAAMRVVKRSFLLSLGYNVFGVSLAVSGKLSPVVVAILMPLSSLTIILFTTLSAWSAGKRRGL